MTIPTNSTWNREGIIVANFIIRRLRGLGSDRGNRVALIVPDGSEMAVAFVSVASGASCAPLNPSYKESELEYSISGT